MKAFEPSSCAGARRGPKHRRPARLESVDDAGHQRPLGPDDREVDALGRGQLDQAGDVLGRDGDIAHLRLGGGAGIARRDEHLVTRARLRALPGERMFAAAAADDQDLHRR